MSPKAKTVYRCTECGADHPKWAGRCDVCGAWNSLVEEVAVRAVATNSLRQWGQMRKKQGIIFAHLTNWSALPVNFRLADYFADKPTHNSSLNGPAFD